MELMRYGEEIIFCIVLLYTFTSLLAVPIDHSDSFNCLAVATRPLAGGTIVVTLPPNIGIGLLMSETNVAPCSRAALYEVGERAANRPDEPTAFEQPLKTVVEVASVALPRAILC